MSEFRHDHVSPRSSQLAADEHLWRVGKDAHNMRADLWCHGESYAVELQILCDGDLLFGRWYDQREIAIVEAHALLQHYLGEGWTIPTRRSAWRYPGVLAWLRRPKT